MYKCIQEEQIKSDIKDFNNVIKDYYDTQNWSWK